MCGIAGIMNLDPEIRVDEGWIKTMCDTMMHRGPNEQGTHVEGPIGIGMRRLSIIDLSGGHQPLSNEDESIWIVFNGEIFNHEELRKRLLEAGHVFKTRSDTETILHLYEESGTECVLDLRGMFAFAIWDRRKRCLFIARDRLGIKPLFYHVDGSSLYFASEIKALLCVPSLRRKPDWTGVDSFFAYGYIPAPLTAFKGILKLLPGHFLIANARGVEIKKYWDLSFHPKLKGDLSEIAEEFTCILRDAVRMRLMSEVPIGAFLSGGIDSSLVVALMSEYSSQAVKTFTIGFGGERGTFLDERNYARSVSERYKTDHQEFEVLPEVEQALDASVDAFDEPFADDSIIPTYQICKLAKAKVTVALTGLGGDENFGGYERYLGFWASEAYERLPRLIRNSVVEPIVARLKEARHGHYTINHVKRFVRASGLSPSHRYQNYLMVFGAAERQGLYLPSISSEIDHEAVERMGWEHFEHSDAEDDCDRALYQDIKTYLPEDILALTDRLSMHHSIELRVPFVDHKVMEFCARIPFKMKINIGRKKYLLRKVAARYVPAAVISHRKQGFASPMAMWLRSDMKGYVEKALEPSRVKKLGILESGSIQTILRAHQERRALNDRQIFALLMFQKWLERVLGL